VSERRRADALQGTRAGFVSRVVAAVIDVLLVFLLLIGGEAVIGAVRAVFGEEKFAMPSVGAFESSGLLLLLLVIVLTFAWSGSGRTLGNAVVGLRVLREDGRVLSWRRALVRAVVVVIFPLVSMLWILVSRKNAGIHDIVCRTAVVYDWRPERHDGRRARVPARGETRRIR
jgi:uncharacterized RDD family membrane protein YckC